MTQYWDYGRLQDIEHLILHYLELRSNTWYNTTEFAMVKVNGIVD
ncbi:MAG: hypothetical protein ACTHKJ_00340 [Candidatus Nitrosocosmicus sp.]